MFQKVRCFQAVFEGVAEREGFAPPYSKWLINMGFCAALTGSVVPLLLYQCNRAAGFSFKQPFESLKRFASSKFIESLNLGFQGFVCHTGQGFVCGRRLTKSRLGLARRSRLRRSALAALAEPSRRRPRCGHVVTPHDGGLGARLARFCNKGEPGPIKAPTTLRRAVEPAGGQA
jgi:hypothetical protein